MGGKPFQSTGCAACRKRKVKCDEQKPSCQKCIKHGISCPGYEGTRIISYDHGKQGKTFSSSKPNLSGLAPHQHVFVDPSQSIPSGPSSRAQVTSSFIDLHFPADAKHEVAVDIFHFLFTSIAALPKKTLMLDQAISAISCVFLGKLDSDARMLQHGVQLYSSAIRHMSRHLERKIYSGELLYVSVIFQELEAIYCPDGLAAYVTHVAGLNSLIKQYRYLVLVNPLTAAIYHKHQKLKVLLVGYMEMSKEDYGYLSQPTKNEPFLELIHILADLSLLCQKSSAICVSEYGACQGLLLACLIQKNKHEAWYARWEEKIGGRPSLYDQ
ncbi:uncharacterized protein N7506_005358, partial [Penicillium brevicompactum]|uniref:uncharacterized protein n=1 Tax=Penicillium brevicompactum TaxID=5074 RepID=UPI002541B336